MHLKNSLHARKAASNLTEMNAQILKKITSSINHARNRGRLTFVRVRAQSAHGAPALPRSKIKIRRAGDLYVVNTTIVFVSPQQARTIDVVFVKLPVARSSPVAVADFIPGERLADQAPTLGAIACTATEVAASGLDVDHTKAEPEVMSGVLNT